VAVLMELLLPRAAELERLLIAGGLPAGIVALEPLAQLVAEGLLLGGESQIHEVSHPNRSVATRASLAVAARAFAAATTRAVLQRLPRVAQLLRHDRSLIRDLQALLEERDGLFGLAGLDVGVGQVEERVGVVDVRRARVRRERRH